PWRGRRGGEPEPAPRRERDYDRDRERAPRRYDDEDRAPRPPSFNRENGEELATYRISVGKRHRVVPGAIVGAIANEGGLRRSDFGHISIRPDYSLVELPANLPNETLEALRRTRISGVLIQLTPDQGAPAQRLNARGPRRDREARPRTERRKPRT
ncbi:DbpA RNA binding domain-containing protein, partial [Nocardia sp. NPDC060220]|uniref:DbpA RNA binding domain-containing protein n=1 Tax=Nocardia sp. NPDC060220 TaxID=3347076 RepID=UPI003666BE94